MDKNDIKNEKKDKNEKIFFPLLDDRGLESRISQHFGHAPYFGLYDMDKKDFKIISNDLDHHDKDKTPIDQIVEAVNPTTIFAKSVGQRAITLIRGKGLGLKTGEFSTVREVLENFEDLHDQIESCGH
ncbi:MAG: NifB/NifX family molybdenum-iron cluster-binding protein [Candidatus Woesearchaeota archaeon]